MCDDTVEHHHSSHQESTLRRPLDKGIALRGVDGVRVFTLVDNYGDMFAPSEDVIKRHHIIHPVPAESTAEGYTHIPLRAEHGYSALITIDDGPHTYRILFDTGISPGGLVHNMSLLDLDPRDIDIIVLSHGHFDHTGGLVGLVEKLGGKNLPLILHPDSFNVRRLHTKEGIIPIPTPSRSYLAASMIDVIEEPQPSYLFNGALLVTGEIQRTTPFEHGFPVQERFDGQDWIGDALVLDDQAMVINIKNQGLVVITGCGHAGIINTLNYATRLTGESNIAAVIGGFHLSGTDFAPSIPKVIEAFDVLKPKRILPAHCTGMSATIAIAQAFPERFFANTVGSEMIIAAGS